MPTIETFRQLAPIAGFEGGTDLQVTSTYTRTNRARLDGETGLQVIGTLRRFATCLLDGETILTARLRDISEHDVFYATVNLDGETELEIRTKLIAYFLALFEGETDLKITGSLISAESSELRLIVDILPETTATNYYGYDYRLTIDNVAVPMQRWETDEAETGAGKTLSVVLTDVDDYSKLTANAVIKLELFIGASEFVEFEGKLASVNKTLANNDNRPNDEVSFTAVSDSTDRLTRSPNRNLTVYDPLRASIGEDEIEPIVDSAGRYFTQELFSIPNLSLLKLFQEIYVNRCGFSVVRTNLPDYPIRRADFNVKSTFHIGVNPFVGMFEPVSFPVGNEYWIVDIYSALPNGFPAPETLDAAKIEGYQSNQEYEKLDGYSIQSAGTELGNFYTTRLIQKTEMDGTLRTETNTTVREYRLPSQPAVIIGEVVKDQTISIYDESVSLTFLTSRTYEIFTFDNFGRQKSSTKTIEKLVPDFSDGLTQVLRIVRTEEQTIQYKNHPFELGTQYQSKLYRRASGLIAVDSENEFLNKPFPQDFIKALEAGNLKDGMTFQEGDIEIFAETVRPLKNGQVDVHSKLVDYVPAAVGRPPIVKKTPNEPKTGDVSLNSKTGINQEIYVFPTDDYVRTGKQIDDFSVGELPIRFAIPLARRRLALQTDKNSRITTTVIGIDQAVRRGMVFNVYDREEDLLVMMIVEGIRKIGEADAETMILRGRQI